MAQLCIQLHSLQRTQYPNPKERVQAAEFGDLLCGNTLGCCAEAKVMRDKPFFRSGNNTPKEE